MSKDIITLLHGHFAFIQRTELKSLLTSISYYAIKRGGCLDKRIQRFYVPMTETSFYILYALQKEMHGYGIMQYVKELTDDEVVLGAGTVYTSFNKMENDGLITMTRTENNRKFYIVTELGNEVLNLEIKRIERLYKNITQGVKNNE